jgi:RND family efflux transporter MFP subunit
MTMTPRIVLITTLLLSLCAGCSKPAEDKKVESPGVPVTVAVSEARDMNLLEESVGVLESMADPVISAEVAAKVLQVTVAVGSDVKAGQVLAILDAGDAGASLQAVKAEVKRLQTVADNQAKNLARLRDLRQQNFISQAGLDDAESQQEVLQAQLTAGRAQLVIAQRSVGKTQVVSPVAGRVEKQIAVIGQFVRVGDPLFQVVSLRKLRAKFSFPETLSSQISRGMQVKISSLGNEAVVTGKIIEVKPMASASNRSFDAFVTFDNPGSWKPGSTLTGMVVMARHANAVAIPARSIVLRPAGQVVYVVDAGKAKQRVVQVGINQDGYVEILQGLSVGETVVVDGVGFLSDGAAVSVPAAKPAAQ